METINLNSYPMYKFFYDIDKTESILQKIIAYKNWSTATDSNSNTVTAINNFYDEELFIWLNKCVKEVTNLYYNNDINFEITECWVNKLSYLQNFGAHTHSHSVISGLFYLHSFENSGATIFSVDNPWSFNGDYRGCHLLQLDKTIIQPLETTIYPSAGTLLLFPSKIYHKVLPNKEKNHRYTLAFNTFPSGTISTGKTKQLEINVVSQGQKVNFKNTL